MSVDTAQSFPLDKHVEILDAAQPLRGYRYVPPDARTWYAQIEQIAGREALEFHHKAVLTHLIAGHALCMRRPIPRDSVVDPTGRAFHTILGQLDRVEPGPVPA